MTVSEGSSWTEYAVRVERLLTEPPWWWEATGRSTDEWATKLRRDALANKCPALIHGQPLYCELGIGSIGEDGFARCTDRFIAHVLRPTGDPDRPWIDTGLRERTHASVSASGWEPTK